MVKSKTIAAVAITATAMAAAMPAMAADLPARSRSVAAPPYGYGQAYATPADLPTRWIDPIHVGATLPGAIPLKPMPERYGIIGYGYAFVNGQPLLIDTKTREIVQLLGDQ